MRVFHCSVCLAEGHNKRTCPTLKQPPVLPLVPLCPQIPDEDPMESDIELTPTPRAEVDVATEGYCSWGVDWDVLEMIGVEVVKVRDRLTLEYWMDGTHRFRKGIRASIPRINKDRACVFIKDKIGGYRRAHDNGAVIRPFIPMEYVVQWGRLCAPYYYKPSPTTKQRTKSQKRVSHCSDCGMAGHRRGHTQCPLNSFNLYFKNGRWRHRDLAKGLIDPRDPLVGCIGGGWEGGLITARHRNAFNMREYVEKCHHDHSFGQNSVMYRDYQ